MKVRRARSIALGNQHRCPRAAARSMGDYFVCARHGRLNLGMMIDQLPASARRALATATGYALVEGRQLIHSTYRRGRMA